MDLSSYLEGINDTAVNAIRAANAIQLLFLKNEELLSNQKRTAGSSLKVHAFMQKQPIVSIKDVADNTGIVFQTALTTLERLCDLEILEEITG